MEPVPAALIAAGHLGAGMAELLLDIPFIHFGAAGQTGARAVAGIEFDAACIRQVGAQPCCQHAGFDYPLRGRTLLCLSLT